jgi:hypothetical protein
MKRTAPDLRVIPSAPADHPEPPGELDPVGRALWVEVTHQYAFDDAGSIEILYQACLCRSRAERCRKLIDEQGEMIVTKAGLRSHPLLRDELQNRALCARLIGKLGMDLEPIRSTPGRPSGS